MGVSAAINIPDTAAKTWREIYLHGAALMPKVAAIVTLAYSYAAYEAYCAGGVWKGYVTAAGFLISIIPFTLIFMRHTNVCLHKMAEGRDVAKEWILEDLLRRWNILNMTRSCLCLISSMLGMATMIQSLH